MVSPVTPITDFHPSFKPLTHTTPFTFTGYAFLEMYEELVQYLTNTLSDELNENLDLIYQETQKNILGLSNKIDTSLAEWQALFDAFMANVIEELEGLNDQAMANLIRNAGSQTRIALNELFSKQVALTPQMFGAKADGVTDDYEALRAFFNALVAPDNVVKGFIPSGAYLHTKPLNFTGNARGFQVEGASKALTQLLYRGAPGTGAGFVGIASKNISFRNFTIDGGFAQTLNNSHGGSFRDPIGVDWHDVHVQNYGGSSLLLFSNDADWGKYGDFVFNNLTCDGGMVANNGLNIVNLKNINGDVAKAVNGGRNVTNSPSYGVQLKNRCENVHITNADAEGWKGGLVMASDGDVGPRNCSIRGRAYDCDYPVLIGKAENNYIFADIGKPSVRAISFGANSQFNTVDTILREIPVDMIPIRFGYHSSTVNIKNMFGVVGVLAEFTGSTTYNRLNVEASDLIISNPVDLVLDNSNRTNNTVTALNQLAQLNATGSTTSSYLRFNGPSQPSWLTYAHGSKAFTLRGNGEDMYLFQQTTFNPGTDNTTALGAASRKWSSVMATNGTIITSDERKKTDITTELSSELEAWSRVEYVKYRMRDSVAEKGDGARWHFGVIAQQVKLAFESVGLNPFDYGILCYDRWEATPELVNEAGEVVQHYREAGDAYAVRYDEALVLEAALMRSRSV